MERHFTQSSEMTTHQKAWVPLSIVPSNTINSGSVKVKAQLTKSEEQTEETALKGGIFFTSDSGIIFIWHHDSGDLNMSDLNWFSRVSLDYPEM